MNHPPQLLQQWYDTLRMPEFQPHYNIAPGNLVQVVRLTAGRRDMSSMRWGFIPSWADDPNCLPILHNARGETIAEKPMFRQAFRQRRCLIPASGFYEWQIGPRRKARLPFYISLRDGTPLSFAGLWDCSMTASGEGMETCVIVTTKANALLEPIHHRMPVLLDPEAWPLWLGTEAAVPDLLALLAAYSSERMQVWAVADTINAGLNDDPALLRPLVGNSVAQSVLL